MCLSVFHICKTKECTFLRKLFNFELGKSFTGNDFEQTHSCSFSNFFPSNAFLRRRRKKALLRVSDRGGGWRTCILALCRVCVCVRMRARPHVTRTSAVNLRRYGNTPQTITIHDLEDISLLCAAHATIMFS